MYAFCLPKILNSFFFPKQTWLFCHFKVITLKDDFDMLFIYFQNMALDCSVKDEKDIITSNTASPHMTFVVREKLII